MFRAVNSRDRDFTRGKLKRLMEQITESIGRYLEALDAADLQEGPGAEEKVAWLTNKDRCDDGAPCQAERDRATGTRSAWSADRADRP
jgi:hypothetical protein